MKRRAWLLFCAASLLFAAPHRAAADSVLLSFSGFDYEDVNLNGTYLDVGEGYKALGDVTSVDPVLLGPYVDFSTKEYTFYMFGLNVTQRFFNGVQLTVLFNNGGRGRYFEDNKQPVGTHRDYGVTPPNVTAPSTFTDGPGPPPSPIKLGGSIDGFVLSYNFNTNNGSFQSTMNLDEGSALIYIPVGQRTDWLLSGLSTNPTVPAGYTHQINGECRTPVTVAKQSTWGALKSLYR